MSCKAILPKTAVIVFLAVIKVIAIKLAKFLIAKLLKLGDRHRRHHEGGGAILATFPNRPDPLSFFRGAGDLTSSVYYKHIKCSYFISGFLIKINPTASKL